MKRLSTIICLLLIALSGYAAVGVTARAPSTVGVGETFRLEYTVNSADVAGAPQISSIPGFDVLYGPAISTSQRVSVVNGHTTQMASTSFTFTLKAKSEGTYQLPSVSLNVGGRTLTSNRPTVRVVKSQNPNASAQSSAPQAAPSRPAASSNQTGKLRPEDLFIEVTANKRTVYEQEPVLLSYNVFTTQALEQLQGKMPDLKGFVAKEVPLPHDKHLSLVNRGGRNIQTTTWSRYVMFPQQSGKLTIPSIPFEGVIALVNRNIDPIDAFFFGQSITTRINQTVHAPSLDITVKPLPPKPAGFSGAVGNGFTVRAALTTAKPRENETLTLRLTIHGTGNLDLITPPQVKFPADFEVLDPQVSLSTGAAAPKLTPEGMSGDIIIDYYAIPNHQGSYTIPPVSLVWFNPADGQYHTSTTAGPITVKVLKGDPNSYAARQRLRNDDIRYIHLGDSAADSRSGFWGTPLFWCLHLLLIALFIFIVRAVFSLSRRSRKPSAAKMAGRVGKDIPSTLLALKQFVAERCGVSEAEVSKDRISALFAERGVDADLTSRLLTLIDSCELHIYGAATPDPDAAGRLGTEAAEVIARLRKQLKKVKK